MCPEALQNTFGIILKILKEDIKKEDLLDALENLGSHLTPDDLQEVLAFASFNGKSLINWWIIGRKKTLFSFLLNGPLLNICEDKTDKGVFLCKDTCMQNDSRIHAVEAFLLFMYLKEGRASIT